MKQLWGCGEREPPRHRHTNPIADPIIPCRYCTFTSAGRCRVPACGRIPPACILGGGPRPARRAVGPAAVRYSSGGGAVTAAGYGRGFAAPALPTGALCVGFLLWPLSAPGAVSRLVGSKAGGPISGRIREGLENPRDIALVHPSATPCFLPLLVVQQRVVVCSDRVKLCVLACTGICVLTLVHEPRLLLKMPARTGKHLKK